MKWFSAMLVVIALARGVVGISPSLRSLTFSWGSKGEASDSRQSDDQPEDVPSLPTCVFTSGNVKAIVNGRKCRQEFDVKDFTEAPLVKWNGAHKGSVLKNDGNITDYTQLTDYRPPLTPDDGSQSLCKAHIYQQARQIPSDFRIESPEMDNFDKKQIAEFAKNHELKGPLGGVQTWLIRGMTRD